MTETTVRCADEDVEFAMRLDIDQPCRNTLSRKIHEMKHRLYADTSCATELEAFYDEIIRRHTGHSNVYTPSTAP